MRGAGVASLLLAAAAVPGAAQPADPLAALAPLSGCWEGHFAGRDLVDRRCVAPILGGGHVRDRHEVVGTGYAGETIYSWDAEAGRIAFAYYNVLGGVARGWLDATQNGVAGDGLYRGPGGETRSVGFALTFAGDRLVQTSFEDGRETARIVFERRPPGAFPELGAAGSR